MLSAATGAALAAISAAVAAPAYADVAPVAHDDNYSTPANTTLNIGAPGVLSNDTDADGDPIHVASSTAAQHGNVSVSGNGAFTYVPTTNYVGPDQFTYKACEVLTTDVLKARALEQGRCDTATVFINVTGTTTTPVPPPAGLPRYQTCELAFAAGVHDIPKTDPRYRAALDRDGDGIACELNGQDGVHPRRPIIVNPPSNTFVTPQAPSNGAVSSGDGSSLT